MQLVSHEMNLGRDTEQAIALPGEASELNTYPGKEQGTSPVSTQGYAVVNRMNIPGARKTAQIVPIPLRSESEISISSGQSRLRQYVLCEPLLIRRRAKKKPHAKVAHKVRSLISAY